MRETIFGRKIHIGLPDRLAREAAEAAANEGETVSFVMRQALREWLASRNQSTEQRSA